jgi:hypothetical protein
MAPVTYKTAIQRHLRYPRPLRGKSFVELMLNGTIVVVPDDRHQSSFRFPTFCLNRSMNFSGFDAHNSFPYTGHPNAAIATFSSRFEFEFDLF